MRKDNASCLLKNKKGWTLKNDLLDLCYISDYLLSNNYINDNIHKCSLYSDYPKYKNVYFMEKCASYLIEGKYKYPFDIDGKCSLNTIKKTFHIFDCDIYNAEKHQSIKHSILKNIFIFILTIRGFLFTLFF